MVDAASLLPREPSQRRKPRRLGALAAAVVDKQVDRKKSRGGCGATGHEQAHGKVHALKMVLKRMCKKVKEPAETRPVWL